MTLKQKNWLCIGAMLMGAFLFLMASRALNAEKLLTSLACLLVMGGLLLHMLLVRCPHCRTWVGRYPGNFCRHCGKSLEWDRKY